MSNNIAPIAEISAEQIGRIADRFSERCRKNKLLLPKAIVQSVLENEGDLLSQEMFEVFQKRVERHNEIIIRHFKVDRAKTREKMVAALGRKLYIKHDVLVTMPILGPIEGDLYFFLSKRVILAEEMALEFESRGLVPDPFAQMQVNIDNPAFADQYPNGVQWKDADDRYCFAEFDRYDDGRAVKIHWHVSSWLAGWWFAGVRKINP